MANNNNNNNVIDPKLFLQDKKFLHQLDKLRIKQQFIKITVLNWNEQPLKEVQGICTSGNLNIDGKSTMRRTATLSIFAEEKENNLQNIDHLFAINKKCKIELGITNNVPNYTWYTYDETSQKNIFHQINYKENYGNIVWFPLGLFVMFNPSISHSLSGVSISMNLKDKMCLLNGDLAGNIHSGLDLATQDQDYDEYTGTSNQNNPTLIYNIIKELVNHWGNEKLQNIIISEVPRHIKKCMKWKGTDTSAWLFRRGNNSKVDTSLAGLEAQIGSDPHNNGKTYQYKYGQDIGFIYADFIYPGELTSNPGDTVTSILDKLINLLGNYQYFYDVYGHFIFQQKRNSLNMSYTAEWLKDVREDLNIVYQYDNEGNRQDVSVTATYEDLPSEVFETDLYRHSASAYNFEYNQYVTNFNNTLNYNNIKNDFVVWGKRSNNISGTKIQRACRFHLAIDTKPPINQEHYINYITDQYGIVRCTGATSQDGILRISSFWQEQLYYQMLESEKLGTDTNTEINNTYFQYYAELKEQFPIIFDLSSGENNRAKGWKNNLVAHPQSVDYYLDFIDSDSPLGQYSVSNIGRRSMIIGNSNEGINCVFEPSPPDIVYVNSTKMNQADYNQLVEELNAYGQDWIQVSSTFYDNMEVGGTANSCYEKIKDLLYQYTNMNNTISLSTLPIYYLEPNTRITISDAPSGIEGDYIIQSISMPLDISGTMTIQASKALSKV